MSVVMTPPGDVAMLARALDNTCRTGARVAPRWWYAAQLFGLGSTSATKLCNRLGMDPEEQCGTAPGCGEGCDCECHHD